MSAIRALTNNIFLKPNYRICTLSNNLKSGQLFPLWGPSATAIRTYAEGKDKKREKGNLFIMEDNPTNRLCPVSSKFEVVLKSDTFVDKSALILAVLANDFQPMVLCTAPRQFGKTVNLSMMQRFLEMEVDENGEEKTTVLEEKDNYKLFSSARFNLKVMENKNFVKTHFGQYPILKINLLSSGEVKSKSDAVDVCRTEISNAFRQHSYLYKSKLSPLENDEKRYCEKWCDEFADGGIPDEDVIEGLADLASYLYKFHKKLVFLLVDEYDSIISNALYHVKNADPKAEREELKGAASFPIYLIGYAVKRFKNIFKGAYITGILDVAGVGISSHLLYGDVKERKFGADHMFQDFYGFTEEEVCTLFNRFEVKEELRQKAEAKYNGYFNGSKKRLYNPQSIVQFLGNLSLGEGALQNYWRQPGYIHNMYKLFHKDSVRMLFGELLKGVAVTHGTTTYNLITLKPLELRDLESLHNILINGNLSCDYHVVAQFLVSQGYLTSPRSNRKLQIPNGDLIDEFIEGLENCFLELFERYGINRQLANTCSESFSKLTILCDEGDSLAKFKEELANFQNSITCLLQRSTLNHPLYEATLQSIITLACTQARFLSGNEIRISDKHFGDVMLYNDKSGIIMELKRDPDTVEDAFKQVFKNNICKVFPTTKYLNACEKAPLSLVMGIHVNSDKKASVMCLQSKDIIDVLDDLKIGAEPLLENRIKMAVSCMGERFINICCEIAIVS